MHCRGARQLATDNSQHRQLATRQLVTNLFGQIIRKVNLLLQIYHKTEIRNNDNNNS